jgi:hypothetical protein
VAVGDVAKLILATAKALAGKGPPRDGCRNQTKAQWAKAEIIALGSRDAPLEILGLSQKLWAAGRFAIALSARRGL